ncbi:MAG: hypothetical protein ABSF60_07800 [Verrucomicrobiota bacterium]
MKIDLHPKPGERERFFIQISEFSFPVYPVQINRAFRCLPDAASSPNESRNLRRSVVSRRFSQLLHWAFGKPTVVPASGTISLEQAVP